MVRSSCTTITRFVIGLLNLILGAAFLALAIVGILLRTNKDFLLKFATNLSERFLSQASKEQADEIAQFLLKHDVEVPVIFIVVGLAVTIVCILGFIASCCSCNKLLQIGAVLTILLYMLQYAVLLTVMVLIQIIAVGVIFGIPNIYRSLAFQSLEKTLVHYNPNTPEGKGPARLWDLIMSTNNDTCCGMDGADDFKNTPYSPNCPKFCCGKDQACPITDALSLTPPVVGCREKIKRCTDEYMLKVLIILAIFITFQVLFVMLGIFGIILLSFKSVVENIVDIVFGVTKVKPEDLHEFARFTIENISGIAGILIVVSFSIAILCFIGFISSCCGFNLLLKIYMAILVGLLLAQIVAVAVIFSNPKRLAYAFTNSTKKLLPLYGNAARPETAAATAVWNAIMGLGSKPCCGLDGYGDFRTVDLPVQCCRTNASICDEESAKNASIPGCRAKIVDFSRVNHESIMYICVVAILLQAVLVVIVFLAICL
ncbi:unnamed protein product [Taenia asiatica]|uniref:Tetraspanin n=1 Tax=Taenia asiatica TaxID=60517 RepID=A0A0R3W1Z2_TAEAS|nr:unnamed protein product [Taenia asiatica]